MRLTPTNALYLEVEPNGRRRWLQRDAVGAALLRQRVPAVAGESAVGRGLARAPPQHHERVSAEPEFAPPAADHEPTFAVAASKVIERKRAGWRNPKQAQDWPASLERHVFPRIGQLGRRGDGLGEPDPDPGDRARTRPQPERPGTRRRRRAARPDRAQADRRLRRAHDRRRGRGHLARRRARHAAGRTGAAGADQQPGHHRRGAPSPYVPWGRARNAIEAVLAELPRRLVPTTNIVIRPLDRLGGAGRRC